MDTRDDWREWERCACDETEATAGDWDTETQTRGDAATSDMRPVARTGRVMVIGFSVIRL